MNFFKQLENSDFSVWVKSSQSIWPYDLLSLSAHAVGMTLVVGISVAVALRILGFAPKLPLAPLASWFPLIYLGFWISLLSGTLLFVVYPVKPVTNPGFYLKMVGVVTAVVYIRRIKQEVFGDPSVADTRPVSASGRKLAATLLVVWFVTITAGRLMAYHGIANVEFESTIAVLLTAVALLLARYAAVHLFGSDETFDTGAPGSGARPQASGRHA